MLPSCGRDTDCHVHFALIKLSYYSEVYHEIQAFGAAAQFFTNQTVIFVILY